MRITVLITSYNDPRIEFALQSLNDQVLKPDQVLVADGGTKWDIASVCSKFVAKLEFLTGNVAETRNKAMELIDTDIVAFLDTDEIAPPKWLENLTKPIINGTTDFTGGPTKHKYQHSSPEHYMNELENAMYENLVKKDVRYLPMGNSAWRTSVIKESGGFNPLLKGSEDYDLNMRAIKKGFRGEFIPEAWVYHDHSDINSYSKLMKKRYKYLKTTANIYFKNHQFLRSGFSKKEYKIKHPFVIIEMLMKPIALIDGALRR